MGSHAWHAAPLGRPGLLVTLPAVLHVRSDMCGSCVALGYGRRQRPSRCSEAIGHIDARPSSPEQVRRSPMPLYERLAQPSCALGRSRRSSHTLSAGLVLGNLLGGELDAEVTDVAAASDRALRLAVQLLGGSSAEPVSARPGGGFVVIHSPIVSQLVPLVKGQCPYCAPDEKCAICLGVA